MKWLYRLEYKHGRHAIENLMYYIVGGMAVVFIMDIILANAGILGEEQSLYSLLAFDRALIFKGQVWRLFSFIFLPPDSSILFIIFSLYFYYHIGTSLESVWSSFRFSIYYFFGMLCTIVFGLLVGYTTNSFLNLSLFFAYAAMFPDNQIMVFYVIPVKIKYLALLDGAYFVYSLLIVPVGYKVALIVAVGNFLLFFWDDMINMIKTSYSNYKARKSFRR